VRLDNPTVTTVAASLPSGKKAKPRDHLVRWRVSLITKTPAKFVDFTLAPDGHKCALALWR
jgi:hypothetical protein